MTADGNRYIFDRWREESEVQEIHVHPETNVEVLGQSIYIQWGTKGIGFGELYFYKGKDGQLYCDNETMNKAFIKSMLCKMVDDCILTE